MIEFEGLERIDDGAPAQWVVEALTHPRSDDGYHVRDVIPDGFEAYVRIFHPSWVGSIDGRSMRWAEIAVARGKQIHHEMQLHRLVDSEDLYSLGGYSYPRSMEPSQYDALVRTVEPFTSTVADCFFCLWDGYGFQGGAGIVGITRSGPRRFPETARVAPSVATPHRDYFLFQGALSAGLFHAREMGLEQTPNLAWPHDRAWCIATEIDYAWTYVGGSRACIDAILASPDLEALETTPEARADAGGDLVN